MYSFRRLNDIIEDLVDSRSGIINKCYELQPEPDAPQLFHFYAQASNTKVFSGNPNFRNTGGVSTDRKIAMAKAVGEAVERYCSAFFDVKDLPLCTYDDADFEAVHPDFFQYFTDEQYELPGFPFLPFNTNTQIRWTEAIDLCTSELKHIPAACVWMPYYFDRAAGDTPIFQPISTGLSCHCSLEEAILGGVLEVVERDAFSMTWQAKLSHPHIIIESLSDDNYDLVRKIESVGHKVYLLNATTDLGIPVILAVAHRERHPAPPLVVAAASELDPETAVRKCLEELVHTRRYMRELQAWGGSYDAPADLDEIKDQIDHLRFWGSDSVLKYSEFLINSENRVEFSSIESMEKKSVKDSLQGLTSQLLKKGYSSYFVDLTTDDVMGLGLRVVRAVVPGLHPFFIGHAWRARNCKRLFSSPQLFGHKPLSRGHDNIYPHPFP